MEFSIFQCYDAVAESLQPRGWREPGKENTIHKRPG
jgi:hypothetical protein